MSRLVIADDEGRTTVVPLVLDEVTVGRKEGNTIRLTERNVSRRHARLYRANGSLLIEDLGSSNGTRVNGVRLRGHTKIKAGDQIQIGDYRILLEAEELPEETTPDAVVPPPPPPPPGRLVLLGLPVPGKEWVLDADEILLGRGDHCRVSIEHSSLSREHARVLRVEGAYRVVDLHSQNGIRVNDQDVPVAELHAGDIVEFGHVRMRFVAPGEDWAFIPEPAFEEPAPARRPPWLLIGGGIAVLAIATVVVVVASGGGEDEDTGASITTGPGLVATPPVQPSFDPAIALERARSAIAREDWATAHAALAQATSRDPNDPEVRQLLRKVELNLGAVPVYQEGMRRLAEDDSEGAIAYFLQIPVESDYRGKPEVAEAVRSYCDAKVRDARRLVARRPEEAREAAQAVLDIVDAPNRAREAAQAIVDRLEGRAPTQIAKVPSATAAPGPSTSRPQPETAEPGPAAATGMEAARECLGRGDQQCVVRALARPRTEREYELLATALAATGQSGRAGQTYCQAVTRFPSSSRRDRWIQQASRLGRSCR